MTDEPKLATDEEKARQALRCLFIEVPSTVAADVQAKVLAWAEAEKSRADAAEKEAVVCRQERDLALKMDAGLESGLIEQKQRIAALEKALDREWSRWNSMNSSRTAEDGREVVRQAMREIGEVLADD